MPSSGKGSVTGMFGTWGGWGSSWPGRRWLAWVVTISMSAFCEATPTRRCITSWSVRRRSHRRRRGPVAKSRICVGSGLASRRIRWSSRAIALSCAPNSIISWRYCLVDFLYFFPLYCLSLKYWPITISGLIRQNSSM
jgi:hypothetical protein